MMGGSRYLVCSGGEGIEGGLSGGRREMYEGLGELKQETGMPSIGE